MFLMTGPCSAFSLVHAYEHRYMYKLHLVASTDDQFFFPIVSPHQCLHLPHSAAYVCVFSQQIWMSKYVDNQPNLCIHCCLE